MKDRLSTKDRLGHLHIDQTCALCQRAPEDSNHLFFQCQFSWEVWTKILGWSGITRKLTCLSSTINWLKRCKQLTGWKGKGRVMAIACTIYLIWKERKSRVFERTSVNPQTMIESIKVTVLRNLYMQFPWVMQLRAGSNHNNLFL